MLVPRQVTEIWSVEIGQSSGGHRDRVPHLLACASYWPQRLKALFVGAGHIRDTWGNL